MASVLAIIKAGDLEPDLRAQLTVNDEPLSLVGADSVSVTIKRQAGSKTVTGSASIIDAPSGVVEYEWQSGDTDTPGRYLVEFRVTWTAGSEPQTFPPNSPLVVHILPGV